MQVMAVNDGTEVEYRASGQTSSLQLVKGQSALIPVMASKVMKLSSNYPVIVTQHITPVSRSVTCVHYTEYHLFFPVFVLS